MNEPSKHHFVPQVYLRYFAKERKKKEFILYVYDKIQNKIYPKNIKDIGYKKDYNRVKIGKYLPQVPNDDVLYYENRFRELIENDWNSIVHNFTATCTLSTQQKVLSYDMKRLLAKLILIQLMRTPSARELTRKIGIESSKELFDKYTPLFDYLPRNDIKKSFIKMKREFIFDEEQTKLHHLLAATNCKKAEMLSNAFIQKRAWIVYMSPDFMRFPFYTSDNPVVFYNLFLDKHGFGLNGINVNTSIIGYPVTPQYFIITFHKELFLSKPFIDLEDKCIIVSSRLIKLINNHQITQCNRQVYIPPYQEIKQWQDFF